MFEKLIVVVDRRLESALMILVWYMSFFKPFQWLVKLFKSSLNAVQTFFTYFEHYV